MKRLFAFLKGLSVIIGFGLVPAACEITPDGLVDNSCCDCRTVANGETTITGNAELDGIFKAVDTLKTTTRAIKGGFDMDVRAMAENVFAAPPEEAMP